ncbi:ATP-dependent nuclease [Lactobacillus taiwanensis]|uniref:ATP-dependent nuclease n=1 Tax=Lactobacillus taiwanensis TaxID=508451 RepID=UPI0025A9F74C|nr:AAA family ATPase [Lactobacillus taiwanensis]
MLIYKVHIKGFRNYKDVEISLNNSSLIIGSNNVGKTNFIYALRLLFDRSLSENDLDLLDSDFNAYSHSDKVEITAYLRDIKEDCLLSEFKGNISEGKLILKYIKERNKDYILQAGFSEETMQELQSRSYLRRLNMQYVDTNRNLYKYLRKERQNLLLSSQELLSENEKNDDKTKTIEIQKNLDSINDQISSLNYIKRALENVNDQLSSLSVENEDQRVQFVAGHNDAEKMLSDVALSYSSEEGPLTLGGDGRNNQIYLATWIAKQQLKKAPDHVTFYAIEEPESHLHPHQQRKLAQYLTSNLNGQVIVTSHSPQIAEIFKAKNIIRLYFKNKYTKAASGPSDTNIKDSFDAFNYRLNTMAAEVFFSYGVFLVEGISEVIFYKALAKENNIDLNRLNISILAVEGVGFKPYINICKALNIPWVLRTDNDVFRDNEQRYYYAGINRVIGIINDCKLNYTVPSECNKECEKWNSETVPSDIQQNNEKMRESFKKIGIYMSKVDLENDLANSKLNESLYSYYEIQLGNIRKLISKMQRRKGENMFEFIEREHQNLEVLNNDELIEPVSDIVYKVKSQVQFDGK